MPKDTRKSVTFTETAVITQLLKAADIHTGKWWMDLGQLGPQGSPHTLHRDTEETWFPALGPLVDAAKVNPKRKS